MLCWCFECLDCVVTAGTTWVGFIVYGLCCTAVDLFVGDIGVGLMSELVV